MNIFKREMKAGLKPFVFWVIGLLVLDYAGMMKFSGISTAGGANLYSVIDKFPRVVLAVFGMTGVDAGTLGGYYAVIFYYVLICGAVYAVNLGSGAVTRELADKTYEFIFTKPCTRSHILAIKLIVPAVYLMAFCVLNAVFSILAVNNLELAESINTEVILFSATLFMTCLMFMGAAAFLSALAKSTEKGSLYGSLFFLYAFIMGIVYDMLDDGRIVRFLSPLKYFAPADILADRVDPIFTALTAILTVLFLWGAFSGLNKRDLTQS